jgi:8-oxo-dGTP diphosphatase
VTVDIALFTVVFTDSQPELKVLLVQRDLEPFAGRWALPGGFVHENEDLPAAAGRELLEETGVREAYVEQVASVGTPGRDPRGHTVTVLYAALLPAERHTLRPAGDARAVSWHAVQHLPKVAFDHQELIARALEHIRRTLGRTRACFELLPPHFTLSDLQSVCESVLGKAVDRRNFRRKLDDAGFLQPVAGELRTGRHRPAQLYRLDRVKFEQYAAREGALPF